MPPRRLAPPVETPPTVAASKALQEVVSVLRVAGVMGRVTSLKLDGAAVQLEMAPEGEKPKPFAEKDVQQLHDEILYGSS